MNTTLILIPTYNESENIRTILSEIQALNAEVDILVIDDNSPDGTGKLVQEIAKTNPALILLTREKKDGLARAYLAGFEWGLKRHYQQFIQMDADLSHDPKDIPRMVEALRSSDAVIGSRYIPGGGTSGWTLPRQLISRGGNVYAQLILQAPYRDLTGGFNGWKRNTLERIRLTSIESKGYAFQVEMKYRAHRLGMKLKEIPIHFKNRVHGVSKMSGHIVKEAALRVIQLRARLAL